MTDYLVDINNPSSDAMCGKSRWSRNTVHSRRYTVAEGPSGLCKVKVREQDQNLAHTLFWQVEFCQRGASSICLVLKDNLPFCLQIISPFFSATTGLSSSTETIWPLKPKLWFRWTHLEYDSESTCFFENQEIEGKNQTFFPLFSIEGWPQGNQIFNAEKFLFMEIFGYYKQRRWKDRISR